MRGEPWVPSDGQRLMIRRVRRLAKRLGLSVVFSETRPSFNYKDRVITVWLNDGYAMAISLAIHDVAHYVVASSRQRNAPNFALGPGPTDLADYGRDDVTETTASRVETDAMVVDGLLSEMLAAGSRKDIVNALRGSISDDPGSMARLLTKDVITIDESLRVRLQPKLIDRLAVKPPRPPQTVVFPLHMRRFR